MAKKSSNNNKSNEHGKNDGIKPGQLTSQNFISIFKKKEEKNEERKNKQWSRISLKEQQQHKPEAKL